MKRNRRNRCAFRMVVVLPLVLSTARPAILSAQVVTDTAAADTVAADTVQRGVSPRGAMIRSFLLPGWGQAAAGSYVRGGIWFSIQSTNWYMLVRSIGRLNQVEEVERRLVIMAMDSLDALIAMDTMAARLLEDPVAYQRAVDDYGGLPIARKLVSARKQQRQDWITYTLFFTLLSGVDAYVNAHLRDFPTSITTEVRADGAVGLNVRVRLPSLLGGLAGAPATASARERRRHPP